MRTTIRPLLVVAAVVHLAAFCPTASAAKIEAVKGKQYKLTRRHGPWMIMVATFNRPPEERRGEGLSPEEAADVLVYELRRKGIPAYTYKPEETKDEAVKTLNRQTLTERVGKLHLHEGLCVLAGNYASNDNPLAQKTLTYVKKFQPHLFQDVEAQGEAGAGMLVKRLKNGGVFRSTPARPGPLSGAFLTTNPMLSEEELTSRTRDPLILQLNSGNDYSLLHNKGKYTVVVATFQGKAHTEVANDIDPSKLKISTALDDAADRAWELCNHLRRARLLGYPQDFEAYVYHDRFSSIVTVGSFQTRDDPRIAEIQNKFGAKIAGVKPDGSPSIGGEVFAVPRQVVGKEPVRTWLFDPYPQLVDVPR